MQMLSQLSYRPVPRIIPDHGKPRERTIRPVSTALTIDSSADVGVGLAAAPEAAAERSERPAAVARSRS